MALLKALFISMIKLSPAGLAVAGCAAKELCATAGRAGSTSRLDNIEPKRILYSIGEIMDKLVTRKALVQSRLDMPDRLARSDLLQRVMRIWLVGSPHEVIGAYWPIKGEFDPLPALYRWQEDAVLSPEFQENMPSAQEGRAQLATESIASRSPRKIGLPVVDKLHKTLTFHAWYPGCPMEDDAYGIPKPKDTEIINPTLLFVPCVGYGPGGYRLG